MDFDGKQSCGQVGVIIFLVEGEDGSWNDMQVFRLNLALSETK